MIDKRIYTGGPIRTMAGGLPLVEAFAVCGERIGAVGTLEKVRKWTGGQTQIIDLGGRTVCPGFIETHNHLSDQAMNLLKVDCTPTTNLNIREIIDRLKKRADQIASDQWIIGQGYDDGHIANQRHLNMAELDEAIPNHPVFIHHVTDHMAYVNSKALAMSGLSDSKPLEVRGGKIGRKADGTLNGHLLEPGAIDLVAKHIPSPTAEEMIEPLIRTIAHYNRYGITSSHDAGLGWSGNPSFILRAYQALAETEQLNIRVYLSIMARYYRNLKEQGFGPHFGSDWLKLGSVKLFQDGSIQIYTAALHQPYFDRNDIQGEIIYSQIELDRLVEEFHADGYQLAIHCNGDAAISSVLEALEKAQKNSYRPDPRHLLIHCQMAGRDHIKRMKALGAMPSYFINHVFYWGDSHVERYLGAERAARISPLATNIEDGLPFTLHSDMPVTPVDPLFAIHCAVNRKTRSGRTLGSNFKVDIGTALKAYTTWGAMASFDEKIKGSIEPGKLADFVVISEDPFAVQPEDIKAIEVLATFINGKHVWGDL